MLFRTKYTDQILGGKTLNCQPADNSRERDPTMSHFTVEPPVGCLADGLSETPRDSRPAARHPTGGCIGANTAKTLDPAMTRNFCT
jgi:hypothetical protein